MGSELRSLPHVSGLGIWGDRISKLGTSLKYRFLGSTPDLLQQMPRRHEAQCSSVSARPQGDSGVHLSLGATALDGGGAMKNTCFADEGLPAVRVT